MLRWEARNDAKKTADEKEPRKAIGKETKDRLLTTKENTIKDVGDNFGRGEKEKQSIRLRAMKKSTSRDTEWQE